MANAAVEAAEVAALDGLERKEVGLEEEEEKADEEEDTEAGR